MSWYREQVLPRLIDVVMRRPDFGKVRASAVTGLDGRVLEIGFGSGLNVPYYPAGVSEVLAVDPAMVGRRLAAQRIAESATRVEFAGLDAGQLPAEDSSIDHVLSTWTLCTVPDPDQVLAEVRRVLRPGGSLHFAEHGLSPDPRVARRQHQFTPLQRHLCGGCRLDRPIDRIITSSGLKLTRLDTYYLPGPRLVGYSYEGQAERV
jgi:SAM-dependent methyltransferase